MQHMHIILTIFTFHFQSLLLCARRILHQALIIKAKMSLFCSGFFYLHIDQVDFNPALAPVYTESLRLCGNWLAETCLESPGVILEKYLKRVR